MVAILVAVDIAVAMNYSVNTLPKQLERATEALAERIISDRKFKCQP